MGFKLKPGQEEFTIVDGPIAGMNYKKGVEYVSAPEGYEERFECQSVETQNLASLPEKECQSVETQNLASLPEKVRPKTRSKARHLKKGDTE